jgi:hypothetical protein
MVLNPALSQALNKLGLLPLEIRDAATGNLIERTVVRSLEDSLHNLGEGKWLVTVWEPVCCS